MNDVSGPARTRRGVRLLEVVGSTLKERGMVEEGETVVVGVSGGADSMCLLDVLHRLGPSLGFSLVVAHLDHGLRGEESEQDYQFVEEQAWRRYGVVFEGKRIAGNAYGGFSNLQAKARAMRYAFFEEVAVKWGARKIATGHHQDDQVETLLLQLLRGAGVARGILPVREGRYIRPLLEVRREEIVRYVQTNGIPFREDSSNSKTSCLRNRLRHSLIPQIQKEVNPAFGAALCRFFSILRDEGDGLDALSREVLQKAIETAGPEDLTLRRSLLAGAAVAVQRRVIRLAFQGLAGSTEDLGYVHIQKICDCLENKGRRTHPQLMLPRGMRVFFDHEKVVFSRSRLWENTPYRYSLFPGEVLPVPEAGICLAGGYIPIHELSPEKWNLTKQVFLSVTGKDLPLVVRNFRPGDRFRPIGLGGEKKLQDLFVDLKVPKSIRYRVPLLEIGGRIAWVVGFRVDERFRVTDETVNCLRVEVLRQEEERR